MASARDLAAKKRIGRNQIEESRKKTPIRDLLSTKADRRADRLMLAREGARQLVEGTIGINKLKELRRKVDKARTRQSTDSNN